MKKSTFLLFALILSLPFLKAQDQNPMLPSDVASYQNTPPVKGLTQSVISTHTIRTEDPNSRGIIETCEGTTFYEQPTNAPGGVESARSVTTQVHGSVMDDFIVPAGETWDIEEVTIYLMSFGYQFPGIKVTIRADAAGTPGANIASETVFGTHIGPIDDPFDTDMYEVILPITTVSLSAGTYWLEIAHETSSSIHFWEWRNEGNPIGSTAWVDYESFGFGPTSDIFGSSYDHVFSFCGNGISDPCATDTEKPTVDCGSNPTEVNTDEGVCEATVTFTVPAADDNCEVASLTFRYREVNENNQNIGGWLISAQEVLNQETIEATLPAGRYRIRWRATDGSGETKNCNEYIDVIDNENPTINCADLNTTFELEDGECYVDVEFPVPGVGDNCGVDLLEFRYQLVDENNNSIGPWTTWAPVEEAYDSFGEDDLGRYKIRWRVTDIYGNNKACTRYFEVVDPDGLPCPWANDHVDCDASSSYDEADESFTLNSDGCSNSISNSDDEYAFVQQTLCGDSEITVKVASLSGSNSSWAGVQMRESADPGSKMVSLMTNKSSNHRKELRTLDNGNSTSQLSSAFNRHWLRIVRTGNSFRGYASSNGSSWFLKFSNTIAMDECIEVGMVVNSYVGSGNATAVFENITVEGNEPMTLQAAPTTQHTVFAEKGFSVFPNPTSGNTTVDLSNYFEQAGVLEVLNVNGEIMQQVDLGLIERSTEQLNLNTNPAGVYMIRLRLSDGTEELQRVILQK